MDRYVNRIAREVTVDRLIHIEREHPLRMREANDLHTLHFGEGAHYHIPESVRALLA